MMNFEDCQDNEEPSSMGFTFQGEKENIKKEEGKKKIASTNKKMTI